MKTGWIKPALIGAAAGSLITIIVGFAQWGGDWNGAGNTRKIVSEATAAALLPDCLNKAAADPANLAKVKAEYTSSCPAMLEKLGWATPTGATSPNSDLAKACAAKLGA